MYKGKNRMKKFLSVLITLSLMLTLLCPTFSVYANDELDLIFKISEDYSGTQGTNNWYYMYRKVANGVQNDLTEYDVFADNNRWYYSAKNVRTRGMIAGPGDSIAGGLSVGCTDNASVNYNTALKFVSPYNGTVTIGTDKFSGYSAYTNVNARILKNGEKIWPSSEDWYNHLGTANYEFNEISVTLNVDDELVFEVAPNYNHGETYTALINGTETESAYDLYKQMLYWQPIIIYSDASVEEEEEALDLIFNASEDYSGVQGQDNWYYKYRRLTSTENTVSEYVYATSNNRWYSTGTDRTRGMICGPNDAGSYTQDVWFAGNTWDNGSDNVFHNPIKEFVSPYDGSATITADALVGQSANTKAYVRILKNGTKIWPSSTDWFYIEGTTEQKSFLNLDVNLTGSDLLVFEVQRAKIGTEANQIAADKLNNQAVKWIPVITFAEGASIPEYVEPAQPEVLFEDTFDTCVKEAWHESFMQSGGYYEVSNGKLHLSALEATDTSTPIAALGINMPYANEYTVDFDMTITDVKNVANSGMQLSFHRQQDTTDYNAFFDAQRTDSNNIVWRQNGANGKSRVATNVTSWVSETPVTYPVKLHIKDHTATLTVNGSDYTYTYQDALHEMGGIEFRAVRANVTIDNFKISGIKEGLSIGEVTLYKDTSVITIPQVAALTEVKAPLDFTVTPVKMFVNIYDENNKLIAVDVDSKDVSAINGGQMACYAINENIPTGAKVKIFFWNGLTLSPLSNLIEVSKDEIENAVETLEGFTVKYTPDAEWITYYGRWEDVSGSKRGNWMRPYFEFDIENAYTLMLELNDSASFSVSIDGENEVTYSNASGKIDIANNQLNGSSHTVRVYGIAEAKPITINAIYTDCEAVLTKTEPKDVTVQFIGDSITANGWKNYSSLVPMELGYNFTIIARSGIGLIDGSGYVKVKDSDAATIGMESAYFSGRTLRPSNLDASYWTTIEWAFENENPDKIFVNLGTNDTQFYFEDDTDGTKSAEFIAKYKAFVSALKTQHPNATIYILKPFCITSASNEPDKIARANAFDAIGEYYADDALVEYIDTQSWNKDITFNADNVHPDIDGHRVIADKLKAYLTQE